MYNRDLIIEAIKPLIGFEQEPGYSLPVGLVTTLDSRKVNQRYPLLNLKNIDLSRPEHLTLESYLESTRSRAIEQAINDIYIHKRVSENVKNNVQKSSSLYEIHVGNLQTQTLTNSKFVGVKVAPKGSDYFRVKVDRFCITLLNPQSINLYIYHSSDLFTPWKTVAVNVTKGGSPFWVAKDDLYLESFSDSLDNAGWYYVGIKTSELEPGNSVLGRRYENWNSPICGSCSFADRKYQDSWFGFMKLNSIISDTSGDAISVPEEAGKLTYGFNMGFTIECDMTKLLIDQKQTVSELVMIKYSEKLMKGMENSPRLNREASLAQNFAFSELHGEWNTAGRAKSKFGIVDEYEKTLKAISFDISELGDRCLPTDKKRGIISWS